MGKYDLKIKTAIGPGRAAALVLAAALLLSLAACADTGPAETAAAETEAAETERTETQTAAETEAALPAETGAAEEETGEKILLYESELITVSLLEVLEDTNNYHLRMKAVSKADGDLYVEIPSAAFNGLTVTGLSTGYTVPAKGDAYMTLTAGKENMKMSGLTQQPGKAKLCFNIYDDDYERLDSGTAEYVFDAAHAGDAETDTGELLCEKDGIRLYYLGIGEDGEGGCCLKVCAENTTPELKILNGGAAAGPGENLELSLYEYVLPETKMLGNVFLYTESYSMQVDPAEFPWVSTVFCVQDEESGDLFMTEPLKLLTGEEGRYTLSEDGKTLTVAGDTEAYDNAEWVMTVSEPEVLVADPLKTETVTPENVPEGEVVSDRDVAAGVCHAGRTGASELRLQYHPAGESLEQTEEYWPVIYSGRTLFFVVTEEGTIEPDAVHLDIPNFDEDTDNEMWYYILDKDGNILSKDTAAG